jgi:transcriptional regulator with GAF, ATPase, and Fis domain
MPLQKTVSPASPLANSRVSPETLSAAVQILSQAAHHHDVREFLSVALPLVSAATHADFAALASAAGGRWSPLGEAGVHLNLPTALLAEALDREETVVEGPWVATPLANHRPSTEALLIHTPTTPPPQHSLDAIGSLGPVCSEALASVRQRYAEQRRLRRLEAILEIASQWNQTHEMETLLDQMARAATRLLNADRASIFLWDRSRHLLVGRPALGVEGGELRIPDDTGLVGQCVQSGEAKRVDLTHGQEQINRQVDKQTGYRTRTLLCVPLRGSRGELFGVFEMINKLEGNFTDEDESALVELASHAAIALENTQERMELLQSRRQLTEEAAQGIQLIGQSPAIEALRSTLRRVADTELAILILGENGTGKEVVSQSIHYLSPRRDQPFIAVNCAALSETLLESELFGHEKGAFTDAHESRAGKFELASGGTLFLDEIGDLSPGGQAKLLRVLEEKVVVRVGGSKSIHTDARVIAATNQDLMEMVRERKFRQDLYFRLNVVVLELPPLRERSEDILLLAEHFLTDFCKKARRPALKFTAAARHRMESHSWPDNVRELRNLMERLAYLSSGDKVDAEDLAFILAPNSAAHGGIALDLPLADATNKFQSDYIEQTIDRAGGNMSEAAKRLGLHRSNLYRKMRQLEMNVNDE